MIAFIERYRETSGLSTATSVTQQRIDHETVLRQFRCAHPSRRIIRFLRMRRWWR